MPRPVLALWWDPGRVGSSLGPRGFSSLASGSDRPMNRVWLADGVPAGEEEATRTFGARLGLDPVLGGSSSTR
ncbi:hypothetical protein ACFOOM_21470 [Streptomyces echinoruber]|uniref:Uncharacterized protein n=1 Tax=Streptomyces echinoruber TaxID=68898 RepID=A0A918V741_9ACTN|nr:hypothetical protein [Streptomyces echinoruber]GGZ76102.1 hypothetical protein GCM10010389_12070 [Streptomyces echinoruber]